jgi:hypothetical protein
MLDAKRRRTLGLCLSIAVWLAVLSRTKEASAAEPAVSGDVVQLTRRELASTFGGQQEEEGVVSGVGYGTYFSNALTYAGGVTLAGRINAGMAFEAIGAQISLGLSSVSIVWGAYRIEQTIAETIGTDIANSFNMVFQETQANYGGSTMGARWNGSDFEYYSDLVIQSESVGVVDDYYCGGSGCMCDDDIECDNNHCFDGYCASGS